MPPRGPARRGKGPTCRVVRWLAYLARQNGLLTLGESVGGNGGASQVAGCMNQARRCGLYALMWAHDQSMAAGGSNATPAEVVAGFNAAWP